jgi:hypothetical protein
MRSPGAGWGMQWTMALHRFASKGAVSSCGSAVKVELDGIVQSTWKFQSRYPSGLVPVPKYWSSQGMT